MNSYRGVDNPNSNNTVVIHYNNGLLYKWFFYSHIGWHSAVDEKATKYRLTIKDIQTQDTGTYTCASPRGLTNSINIVVASEFN